MSALANPRGLWVAGALLFALLSASVVLVAFGRDAGEPTALGIDAPPAGAMKAGAFDPPHMAPEFSLAGSDGSEVTLQRFRGKIVLLTFGFTYCAAVCPTTLSTLAQAQKDLGSLGSSVQVIFVTVDPERDTAEQMRSYVSAFNSGFLGATGSTDALAEVRRKYGVTAERKGDGPDYAVAHTSSIFLIDRSGKLRAMMPYGRPASDFVHDIKLLAAE